jgi:hypothetical protein
MSEETPNTPSEALAHLLAGLRDDYFHAGVRLERTSAKIAVLQAEASARRDELERAECRLHNAEQLAQSAKGGVA